MERIELPLAQMTLAQKLDLMEMLWADLSTEPLLDSPAWHENILENREAALADGRCTVSDWEEAKERIKRNVSCKIDQMLECIQNHFLENPLEIHSCKPHCKLMELIGFQFLTELHWFRTFGTALPQKPKVTF